MINGLELTLRILGFVVAGLGTCAAVPDATWSLIKKSKELLAWLRDRLRRRRSGRATAATAHESAAFGSSGALGAAIEMVSGSSFGERLAVLEQRLASLDQAQQKTAVDLKREVDERTRAIAEVRGHIQSEVAEMKQTLVEQQREDEEINASALPIILGGAFLSTFSDLFPGHLIAAYLAVCSGLALGLWAVVVLDKARTSGKHHSEDVRQPVAHVAAALPTQWGRDKP